MRSPPISPETAPAQPPAAVPERCRNCGTGIHDRFCARCGQPAADRVVSLRRMAAEFADDQFTLNSAVPRTLVGLFVRPGFLTREYVAGRIARYVRPFRIFLVSVVGFFLAVSMVAGGERMLQRLEAADDPLLAAAETEGWSNVGLGADTTRVPGWMVPATRRVQAQEERLNAMPPGQAFVVIIDAAIQAASRVAFLLVPAFAGLLKLLHLFRRRLYVEHFVFALHFHTVAFAMLAVALLVGAPALWAAVGVYLLLYLLIALRRVYEQPWWLATLKGVLILLVYPLVLGVGAVIAMLAAIVIA